jgi:hypothetical protein
VIEPRSGVWWTDGDPSLRVPGALVRVDDWWQLDLIGNLPVNHQWRDAFSLVPSTTVYGACLGTRYTLRRAYLTESKGHVAGMVLEPQPVLVTGPTLVEVLDELRAREPLFGEHGEQPDPSARLGW